MPKVPRGGYLKKVLLIITDGLTKELCFGAYLFSRSVIRIGRKSGWLHCALYLKQCASSLQNGSVLLIFPTRKPATIHKVFVKARRHGSRNGKLDE